jgi:hypothetical protein
MKFTEIFEEYFCIENCTNCDPTSSFCELIHRLPVCQCKNGYIKISNGYNERNFFIRFNNNFIFRSCILEDNLCNWSYRTCAHANLTQKTSDIDLCSKKKSTAVTSDCQCDRGYEIKQVKTCLL